MRETSSIVSRGAWRAVAFQTWQWTGSKKQTAARKSRTVGAARHMQQHPAPPPALISSTGSTAGEASARLFLVLADQTTMLDLKHLCEFMLTDAIVLCALQDGISQRGRSTPAMLWMHGTVLSRRLVVTAALEYTTLWSNHIGICISSRGEERSMAYATLPDNSTWLGVLRQVLLRKRASYR